MGGRKMWSFPCPIHEGIQRRSFSITLQWDEWLHLPLGEKPCSHRTAEPLWTFWRREESLATNGIRVADRPPRSPVAIRHRSSTDCATLAPGTRKQSGLMTFRVETGGGLLCHGNEAAGSIKCGEFLYHPRNNQPFKKTLSHWVSLLISVMKD